MLHHFFDNAYDDVTNIRWHIQAGDARDIACDRERSDDSRSKLLLPPSTSLSCSSARVQFLGFDAPNTLTTQHTNYILVTSITTTPPFAFAQSLRSCNSAFINHQHVDCLNGDRPWYLQRRRLDRSISEQARIFRSCSSNIG